jgi:signal transduction histidine kinase
MGTGIAQVAAAAGHRVILADAIQGATGRARANIARAMDREVEKGRLTREAADALIDRIGFQQQPLGEDLRAFETCGLVIEAIGAREVLGKFVGGAIEHRIGTHGTHALLVTEAIGALDDRAFHRDDVGGLRHAGERQEKETHEEAHGNHNAPRPVKVDPFPHFTAPYPSFVGSRKSAARPLAILRRMVSVLFVLRRLVAWAAGIIVVVVLWASLVSRGPAWPFLVAAFFILAWVIASGFSHVRRVKLISDRVDPESLGLRHRNRIEVPFAAGEAFDLVEAAIRELPNARKVQSARDSLQVHARVLRRDPYGAGKEGGKDEVDGDWHDHNQVRATVTPGGGTSSVTLICEPGGGPWADWFKVDDGTNLENMQAITRAISRRLSERRREETEQARETATQKELTVAKLSLLHAQVEPHFLYNTLASAQILTRSDPAKADQMLGNLIVYLRTSLPRTEDSLSTLGEEVERARAYLEILRLRMGERLALQIQVPDTMKRVPMPPMMLQTLVENAIKHGLEPSPRGGTVWITAREADGKSAITVADDGRGFSDDGGGTGIGLKNVRERLRLAYGEAASFAIVSNYPNGVAATITVPSEGPVPHA